MHAKVTASSCRRHVTADELQSLFAVTVTVRRVASAEQRLLPLTLHLSLSLVLPLSVYLLARNYIWLLIALCIFMDGPRS